MMKTFYAALFSSALAVSGCGGPTAAEDDGPDVTAQREQFMLASEPAGVMGVLDLRESIQPGEPKQVVLVGRIGGVDNPWTDGKAVFVIIDPAALAEEDADHVCEGEGCPHCAKRRQQKKLSSLALVQFVGPGGKVAGIDARKLFGLEAGQTVVVRGNAQLDELDSLIISADGLYVRE